MKGHVNSSGFPLQIAVANAINETNSQHGWTTRYTEHSWQNSDNGESGFIDMVVSDRYKTQFLVVECKRVKDTSWIFLLEGLTKKNWSNTKSFIFKKDSENIKKFGWYDLSVSPYTYQSQYCVIPGTGSNSQSLIERTAAELVSSTEGIALEDKLLYSRENQELRIYYNVIVTTAQLKVCHIDPSSISLKDGTLTDAEFEDVPYIRFRKQLNPIYEMPDAHFRELDLIRAKENTVFVVNSQHLVKFLSEFEIDEDLQSNRVLR